MIPVDRNRVYAKASALARATKITKSERIRFAGKRVLQHYRSSEWLFESAQTVALEDYSFTVYPRVHFGDVLAAGKVYEGSVRQLFRELIDRGDTVVDLGAHWGYHTTLFSRLVGQEGAILAIEPMELNLKLLELNVADSPYSNVTISKHAITQNDGDTVTLHSPAYNLGCSTLRESSGLIRPLTDTALTSRLDTLLESLGFSQVTLLKVDIEGAESDALSSLGALFPNVQAIFVELHHQYLSSIDYETIDRLFSDRIVFVPTDTGLNQVQGMDDLYIAESILACVPSFADSRALTTLITRRL